GVPAPVVPVPGPAASPGALGVPVSPTEPIPPGPVPSEGSPVDSDPGGTPLDGVVPPPLEDGVVGVGSVGKTNLPVGVPGAPGAVIPGMLLLGNRGLSNEACRRPGPANSLGLLKM